MSDLTHDQQPAGWSAGAEGYESAFAPFSKLYSPDAIALLGLQQGERFLDACAGTGAVALPAARLGAEVTAVDFAPGMVTFLRDRSRADGLSLRVEEMDGQALHLPDAYFDAAGSMFGLIFFPDIAAGMSELARVTKPGGRVLVGSWDRARFPLFGAVFRALAQFMPAPPDPSAVPVSMRIGERGALQSAFESAGLVDVKVHEVTHTWRMDDPARFLASASDWSPPLQPLLTALSPPALETAQRAFADAVADMSHSTGGLETTALLGIGRRVPS